MKLEEAKTIKVSPKVYAELNAFTELLSGRLKRHVSVDDALEDGLIVDLTNNVRHFNKIKHLKVISGK